MTAQTDKITDAFVLLRVYSETLTVDELKHLAAFEPTEIGIKGTKTRPNTSEVPANYIFLSTETLVLEKDLNAHVNELGRRLPLGNFAARFEGLDVSIYLTIYWWTKEEVNFHLDHNSLSVLANLNVPAYFNLLIDNPA